MVQLEECLACLLHSILLHRTRGKITYRAEGNYSIGTVGIEDVDCQFVDITYARVASRGLIAEVARQIEDAGKGLMKLSEMKNRFVTVVLEFYQRHKSAFGTRVCKPWEIWRLNVCVKPYFDQSNETPGPCLDDVLSDKVVSIVEAVSRHEFLPNMPVKDDMDLVYSTAYSDIQPYLFKITTTCSDDEEHLAGDKNTSNRVGATMRRLLSDLN